MGNARLKRCAHCGRLYLYGKAHGATGRYRYCSADCAQSARDANNRIYRRAYRDSPEGKEQHADEERERRRRARRRNSVGDHSGQAGENAVKVEAMNTPPSICVASEQEPVEWKVEVSPELAHAASRLCARRQEMTCVVCGRRGYVAAVVVLAPKRRRE